MKSSKALLAGALVVVVAACGGHTPKSTTPPPSASVQATPASTPAPDLKSEMLAANNLPAGWSLTSTTESTSSEPQCLINAQAGLKGTSNAEATFVYGSGGLPVLGEYLAYLPGQGQSALTSASQTLAGCGQISTSSAGQTLSGTLGSMPFTAVADQSSAYQASLTGTVSGQSVTLGIDVVVFRKSDTVAMIFYANLGTPDATALQQIVQSAAAKLS